MSATLRISDFVENQTLFPTPPPVIDINARQYPVTTHFSRTTQADYTNLAVKKACKIHSKLPPGGILIFLTGQNEINGVCRKLEKAYGPKVIANREPTLIKSKANVPPVFADPSDGKETAIASKTQGM